MIARETGTKERLEVLSCPLCLRNELEVFFRQTRAVPWRLYHFAEPRQLDELCFYRCQHCFLVIKDPAVRIAESHERPFYSQHDNQVSDERYLSFLRKLAEPVISRLSPDSYGLDFGSGASPAMAHLFAEAGHRCESYDVHFHPRLELLERSYDFITCSEVFEHLKDPHRELEIICGRLMKPAALLGVMTSSVPESPEEFERWHYHLDPTHIAFYSPETFRWIADRWRLRYLGTDKTVTIFQKEIS